MRFFGAGGLVASAQSSSGVMREPDVRRMDVEMRGVGWGVPD